MSVTLHLGDCLEILRTLPDASVDSVVTDPPAGIGFMGKAWDRDKGGRREWIGWLSSVLAECLRIARPGSVLLCWALPRTSHWTGTAIEDAGWQIEDRVSDFLGRSSLIGPFLESLSGEQRQQFERILSADSRLAHCFGSGFPKHKSKLKPAVEDWWLARKPGPKWLNVDGCRVGYEGKNLDGVRREAGSPGRHGGSETHAVYEKGWEDRSANPIEFHPSGRWPANLVMSHSPGCVRRGTKQVASNGHFPKARGKSGYDGGLHGQADLAERHTAGETVADYECADDCPIRLMGEQGGTRTSGKQCKGGHIRNSDKTRHSYGTFPGQRCEGDVLYGDSGSAARFFPNFDADPFLYCPKASRKDRNSGCEGMEERDSGVMQDDAYRWEYNGKGNKINLKTRSANHHPTVKPEGLMRWLCRLATPPGGVILDPFAGSGSTGKAAVLEGFSFIGIERYPEYHAIAERRIAEAATPLFAEASA